MNTNDPSRRLPAEFAAALAIFAAASLALASPALTAFFISDDLSHLYISSFESPSWLHWLKPFNNGFWRPYVLLSGRVFVELFGPKPLPFHLMAAALHALAAACFYLFLRGVLAFGRGAAFGAAGLFVLHSGGWETLYTHQNCMDSALAAAILAGLVFWKGFIETGSRGKFAAALAMLGLAMGAKETAIVAAPIFALWDVAFAADAVPRGKPILRAVRWNAVGAVLVLGAIYAAWTLYRIGSADQSYVADAAREPPMTASAQNAARQMLDYIASAFVPYLHVIDAPFRHIALSNAALWAIRLLAAAGMLGWVAFLAARRDWITLACLGSALALLAPPSVKSGPPASHYLYPALPFLLAAAIRGLAPLFAGRRALAAGFLAASAAFLAAGYGFSSIPRDYVETTRGMERFIAAARAEAPRWTPGQTLVIYELPHPGDDRGRYIFGQLALFCFFPEVRPRLAVPPLGQTPEPAAPPAVAYVFDGSSLVPAASPPAQD